MRLSSKIEVCDHGCPPPMYGRDPHMVALEDLFHELAREQNGVLCFARVFPRHVKCIDRTMRKLLIAMGTDHIRMDRVFLARRHAEVILAMERYLCPDEQETKEMRESIGEDGETKYFTDSDKDLYQQLTALREGDRDVIIFFALRTPCACLNDKLRALAGQPRTGRCINPSCLKTALDSTLMDCSSCKLVKYCSKECQRAHWPKHKKFCSMVRVTYKCQNRHCSTGQTTNLFDCAQCKKVKYCSKACQKADWPVHKRCCGRNPTVGDNKV